MVATAPSDGKISQSDNDRDRDGGTSPSDSLSPALSSSPMPFLPALETTFTPLSMDSNFDTNTSTSQSGVAQPASSQYSLHKPDASLADAGHYTASFGDAPSLPLPNFSPRRAVATNQQEPNAPGQALDTRAEANFASGAGASYNQIVTEANAFQLMAGGTAEELSQLHLAQQPVLIKPKPIVRTASTKSVSLRHPTPDPNPRSVSRASNIAQLEATAEKLSMTSSIDDAIRELHEEQKRVDSRRSSILAASIASIPETEEFTIPAISKQIPVTSSIRDTNTAARHGGYSPAGYVMSPSSNMMAGASRLRSGSTGISKSDADSSGLSRHGPGKGSVRSVRSITVPTLTNIAEIEPTALTAAAMDEADKLAEHDEDEILHIPQIQDIDLTPNANIYYDSSAHDYWGQPIAQSHQQEGYSYAHDRPPTSAGSDGTFEQAERAFADFDGAHCSPDVDFEESANFQPLFASHTTGSSFIPSFDPDSISDENENGVSQPLISPPTGQTTVRPKSYLNPDTGEKMLYYPARVPLMLNLPQKLSKKPKTQAQDARKSQVLSVMPNANRPSTASWLPELHPEPLLDPLGGVMNDSDLTGHSKAKAIHQDSFEHVQDENQLPVEPHAQSNDSNHRMSRISMMDIDKRRSQLPDLGNLPPQLRASAYFELPSQVPKIQLKDGSATSTLDDILNASARAPVSAFTDHAFAGSLGAEVYGSDKKRKSHMKRASTTDLHESKNRSSFFHLRKPSALSRHSSSQEERKGRDSIDDEEERQRPSTSINGDHIQGEEGEEEKSEESEEELAYHGPPTTLLAELQMRKQQQKLRTRPAATAFPNGMHSTLLELDRVAEVERQARKGKRVNLAWEDPNANQAGEDDDEDTPLGLILANKGQETGLIATIGAPRPLGLMERRDMEDNEPLSVRRNRLHGKEAGPIQRMTLSRSLNLAPALRAPSPQLRVVTPEGDEIEDETLGDRMRRLRSREDNNPLPQHRPVSSSFSAELLSQIGDAFKEDAGSKDTPKEKGSSPVPPTEEEETLGQRRLRLQAEREARDREMARVMLNGGRSSVSPQLTKRHSMADVLGNQGKRTVLSDPRMDAERLRLEEAARYKEEQKRKLAALRHQMPSNLSAPNLVKPGGFMSGRFNDGAGGGFGQPRESTMMGGFGSASAIPNPALNASAMGNAFRVGGAMSAYGPPMANGYANPYGASPQVQSTGQMASIERWRQGIS
ncbi:hypothetical protein F5B22DRAFT_600816 [Xylaria bambusicola]|uniref:uncharacterized protein n=1 Tax=Xylaria bambusicola TaxID=326684 RepID=UPI0020087946|nr:uncharacterized protein F5B22DRAFT_600816 [Xylaria bambusicola]KAI0518330.1 hypothetical protein F5B22DRAFT_600816 [Xylaria bambusicola]